MPPPTKNLFLRSPVGKITGCGEIKTDISMTKSIHFTSVSRKGLILLLFTLFSGSLFAQDKARTSRPDIPGSFIVDFGFNQMINAPADFQYTFFGSHTVNLYYQYPIRFGRSHYSFNPGIGVSLERFRFKSRGLLYDSIESGSQIEHYDVIKASLLYTSARKTMLIGNYLEIPLEFRFDTKPEDIARSFNFALGGRVGYLIDSQQKIKYKENAQVKKVKDKQDFGLTKFRYGVYARVGIGGFNVFGFYNLTPLFQTDKGPDKTTANSMTIGISLNGF